MGNEPTKFELALESQRAKIISLRKENMTDKLPVKTVSKLIDLRNLLDSISQISWSFSVLNKQHPIADLTESEAFEIIEEYKKLIKNVKDIVAKI